MKLEMTPIQVTWTCVVSGRLEVSRDDRLGLGLERLSIRVIEVGSGLINFFKNLHKAC